MSTRPFDTGLVIARLRERIAKDVLRNVGGAADYASVRSLADFPVPAAYVLLGRERAEKTSTGVSVAGKQTPLAQVAGVTFAVVMAVRNYRQLEGAALREALGEHIGLIRNELLGWTPPANGARACQLLQGDLTAYDTNTAVWTDVWQTQHILKPEAT